MKLRTLSYDHLNWIANKLMEDANIKLDKHYIDEHDIVHLSTIPPNAVIPDKLGSDIQKYLYQAIAARRVIFNNKTPFKHLKNPFARRGEEEDF